MYAVKDNRISLMERMMELGCDLTTVNKVPKLDSFSFFFFLGFFFVSVKFDGLHIGVLCLHARSSTLINDSRQQVMIIFYGGGSDLSSLGILSIKQPKKIKRETAYIWERKSGADQRGSASITKYNKRANTRRRSWGTCKLFTDKYSDTYML